MTRGRCRREVCECVGHMTVRAFCPDFFLEEEPPREIDVQSVARFGKLPGLQRIACLAVLRLSVPRHARDRWRDQAARGMRIGSEDPLFHLGVGMAVRNTLRRVLPDDRLPAVAHPEGGEHRNWDDYYYGAIDALARTWMP